MNDANWGGQIEQLRAKWPQAHAEPPRENDRAESLIALPGFLLPPGYNKTICTALFLAQPTGNGTMQNALTEFWIDTPDLCLDPPKEEVVHYSDGPERRRWWTPKRSCQCGGPWDGALPNFGHRAGIWDGIPGFPQWRELRLFLWRAQSWNPNRDTLFTAAMLIRQRLRMVA